MPNEVHLRRMLRHQEALAAQLQAAKHEQSMDYLTHPERTPAPFSEAPVMPSVDEAVDDHERQQRWWHFETACREFAASEPDGYAACLRALSRAMTGQRDLIEP